MEMRTTLSMMLNQSLTSASQQTERLSQLQTEASTGKKINVPSDDPADAVSLLTAKRQDAQLGTYLTNVQSATTTLDASTAALQQVSDIFTQAKQIAIEGSQSGTTPESQQALADQVDQLLNQLVDTANTKSGDQYLFSGAASTTQPFAVSATNAQGQPQTVTYQGASTRGDVIVGPQRTVDTLYAGNDILQNSQYDAFQSLIALRDNLRNTSGMSTTQQAATISNQIGDLENVQNGVLDSVGEQSASLQNLQDVSNNFQDMQLAAKKWTTDLEGADITDVAVQLQQQQNQLQLTLASTAQVLSVNLLDFLK